MIAPTGGWQNWTTVTLPITPPAGTHGLFFVFKHPTDQGGLMNLNWFQAVGAGAAVSEAPEVAATATPRPATRRSPSSSTARRPMPTAAGADLPVGLRRLR